LSEGIAIGVSFDYLQAPKDRGHLFHDCRSPLIWFQPALVGDIADDRFISAGDEAAFSVLLKRHGPLVLRVCHGILHDSHDAEDAFQAT
jgi:hypothetical protein